MTQRKIIGFYNYTVIMTYAGMLFAFFGILKAIQQEYLLSLVFLIFSGICDMFDGAIASTRQRVYEEKRFGIQIDSLCDLISFGVLPGIFVYMISGQHRLSGIITSLYVLSALIRLSYFNVMEEARQNDTEERRKSILGIPVTVVAGLLPTVFLLYTIGLFHKETCFLLLLILLSAGFLMPAEIKKPGLRICVFIAFLGLVEISFMATLYFRGL